MAKKKTSVIALSKEDAAVHEACKGMQLLDIRLVGCRVGQTPQTMMISSPPENLTQRVNVQCEKDDETGQIIVLASYVLRASDTENIGGEEHLPFVLEAMFAVAYKLAKPSKIDAQLLQRIGEKSGVFHSWSFWREFVQSMTTRMGLPALRVQLLPPGGMQFSPTNPGKDAVQPGRRKAVRVAKKSRRA